MMRAAFAAALFGVLLPGAAMAQQPAPQTKCGPLKILNEVQMKRIPGGVGDHIPFTINGNTVPLRFDTGGAATFLGFGGAAEIGLSILHTYDGVVLITGSRSNGLINAPNVQLGQLKGGATQFPVGLWDVDEDGLFGLDYIGATDADVDFGTDIYRSISPDHCPGAVVYWKADAVGVAPIRREFKQEIVDLDVDGQTIEAVIDTGSPETLMRDDVAQKIFKLTLGGSDTPLLARGLNGVARLKTYSHIFKTMNFGGVSVTNPAIVIFPDAATHGSRTDQPPMILGMDVMRKLHLYFSFEEGKLYVTAASTADPQDIAARTIALPTLEQHKANVVRQAKAYVDMLAAWSASSQRAIARVSLGDQCWWRSTIRYNMDAALAACDGAIEAHQMVAPLPILQSYRGFALYQMGHYEEALTQCDTALASGEKNLPAALLIRGYAKGRLGDQDGKKADVEAALAIDPNVERRYLEYGIGDDAPAAAPAADAAKTP